MIDVLRDSRNKMLFISKKNIVLFAYEWNDIFHNNIL